MNDAEKVELYEKFLKGLVKRFGAVVVDPLGPDDDEDDDGSDFNDAYSRYGGNMDDAYEGGREYGEASGKSDIADEASNVLHMTGAYDDNEESDCG